MVKKPTDTTEKKLYGLSMNQCSNPNCEEKVIAQDKTNIGEVAHIEAESEGGLRYNPKMTEEERRHLNNLILLCRICHKVIDNKENENIYTVEILKRWKEAHENKKLQTLALDYSPLKIAVNKIADAELSGITNDDGNYNSYKISDKLSHNNLLSYKPLIEKYKIFYPKINSIYTELEYQGCFKKEKLLRNIEIIYTKTKGKYITNHENSIESIRINSDKIFEDIENQLLELVSENNEYNDNMCYGVSIVMVDAFIRCKILEEPTA